MSETQVEFENAMGRCGEWTASSVPDPRSACFCLRKGRNHGKNRLLSPRTESQVGSLVADHRQPDDESTLAVTEVLEREEERAFAVPNPNGPRAC